MPYLRSAARTALIPQIETTKAVGLVFLANGVGDSTHLFGAGCSLLPPHRQGASDTVVLNHDRMVH